MTADGCCPPVSLVMKCGDASFCRTGYREEPLPGCLHLARHRVWPVLRAPGKGARCCHHPGTDLRWPPSSSALGAPLLSSSPAPGPGQPPPPRPHGAPPKPCCPGDPRRPAAEAPPSRSLLSTLPIAPGDLLSQRLLPSPPQPVDRRERWGGQPWGCCPPCLAPSLPGHSHSCPSGSNPAGCPFGIGSLHHPQLHVDTDTARHGSHPPVLEGVPWTQGLSVRLLLL